nr:hypothetical protein Iba_chr13bCG7650 [Ipomoea batatas]
MVVGFTTLWLEKCHYSLIISVAKIKSLLKLYRSCRGIVMKSGSCNFRPMENSWPHHQQILLLLYGRSKWMVESP